ncbi:hypothetical protein [Alteromonas sp. D210916BOD_24]|uniref:hypothetical protein n=1 Tax=Alteromonas sp. D210916BOD_24 TaxID=3157618 RepID=UPI00399C4E31
MKVSPAHFFAFKSISRCLAVCCASGLLIACESTPPPLDSSLIPESHRKAHQASLSKAKACPLKLEALEDLRASKDLLVGNENIAQDILYQELKGSLFDMNVTFDNEVNNRVKVSLERAFVKSLGGNLIATVIINAQYKPHYAEAFSPPVTYRGQSTKVNVVHNEPEQKHSALKSAMVEAIKQVTQRLKSSLLHQCEDPTESLDIS